MARIIIRHQGTPLLFHCMRKRKRRGTISRVGIGDCSKGLLCCAVLCRGPQRVASPGCQTLSAFEALLPITFALKPRNWGSGSFERHVSRRGVTSAVVGSQTDRRCFGDPARWHDGDAAEGWAFCQFVCVRGDGGRLNRAIA
jgi:hypothetical protein